MTSGLTSGQIIRLRQCLQRGTAFGDPVGEQQAAVVVASLAAEIAARIAGDAALSASIAAETGARIAADNALQSQITELQKPRYDKSLLLGGM